jgi:hypothetical protein
VMSKRMSPKKQNSVRDHKDYQKEVERLEFTKEYMVRDIFTANAVG